MSTVFKDDEARRVMREWYGRFRARVPGAEGRMVATRFGQTHVLTAGREDAPPLVVLHGAFGGGAHMLTEATTLLEDFRIYAVDIIGQSVMSADARLPIHGPACGEWLVDVLDGLGLAKAHVYGASWGGFMASRLAEHAPERVDRLVLLVPAGIMNPPVWGMLTKLTLPMLMYRAFPSRARLLQFLGGIMTTVDDVWADYFCDAFRSYRLDMRAPPLASPASLARFERPTLVIGAADDVFFPGAKLLERAKVVFPHAETELLEARHVPPLTDAFRSWLGARITRFLEPAPVAAPHATAA